MLLAKIYTSIINLDLTKNNMAVLSCSVIGGKQFSVHGFILSRKSLSWDDHPHIKNLPPARQSIGQIVVKLFKLFKDAKYPSKHSSFQSVKISQNWQLCEQFGPDHPEIYFSVGFNFKPKSLFWFLTVIFTNFYIRT